MRCDPGAAPRRRPGCSSARGTRGARGRRPRTPAARAARASPRGASPRPTSGVCVSSHVRVSPCSDRGRVIGRDASPCPQPRVGIGLRLALRKPLAAREARPPRRPLVGGRREIQRLEQAPARRGAPARPRRAARPPMRRGRDRPSGPGAAPACAQARARGRARSPCPSSGSRTSVRFASRRASGSTRFASLRVGEQREVEHRLVGVCARTATPAAWPRGAPARSRRPRSARASAGRRASSTPPRRARSAGTRAPTGWPRRGSPRTSPEPSGASGADGRGVAPCTSGLSSPSAARAPAIHARRSSSTSSSTSGKRSSSSVSARVARCSDARSTAIARAGRPALAGTCHASPASITAPVGCPPSHARSAFTSSRPRATRAARPVSRERSGRMRGAMVAHQIWRARARARASRRPGCQRKRIRSVGSAGGARSPSPACCSDAHTCRLGNTYGWNMADVEFVKHPGVPTI